MLTRLSIFQLMNPLKVFFHKSHQKWIFTLIKLIHFSISRFILRMMTIMMGTVYPLLIVTISSQKNFAMQNLTPRNLFSVLHLNIHSIQKHIETLQILLLTLESQDFEFDIIAISESILKANSPPTVDINIENYHQPLS